jgi:hypothetical protein
MRTSGGSDEVQVWICDCWSCGVNSKTELKVIGLERPVTADLVLLYAMLPRCSLQYNTLSYLQLVIS